MSASKKGHKAAAALYVPRHRRGALEEPNNQETVPAEATEIKTEVQNSPASSRSSSPVRQRSTPSGTPVRKGRGQFTRISSHDGDKNAEEKMGRRERAAPTRVYPQWQHDIDSAKENGGGQAAAQSAKRLSEKLGKLSLQDESSTSSVDGGSAKPDSDSEEDDWERLDEEDQIIPVMVQPDTDNTRSTTRVAGTVEDLEPLDGPTTVLDVYDFPAAFKTHDIEEIFQDFSHSRGGYRIKWISDTQALIIFQHPDTAKAAYAAALGNPFIKVKPYTGKVSRDTASDRPLAPRPIMTDMVARRLVAGALGVRSKRKTEEEAARDRQKLQEAKDKREEQRKAKEAREKEIAAAWDG
ncbi:uncharacterized protein SPPG_04304 [Spizellomyces punctatus DAOM BR117]|uniref:Thc1 RRM domain-containing protein n=1 Tax=Spizellomyces punctatus (strain DAOM BR117) TaxID=645134 RepID=A0A0L0HJK9_SPIPD|nr:uncharacterized protein SPPG_04304 [Spizellomyces punctatus DAOM BR117]KND01213.1 hypothetical protein SPPG_04304 [Spizellomyces punctatus DAOM BR117]|eukprot:XP_016609252.1 hypothetical protein SPPG_04304 [Spizellomyces punctatus DAOM BR117]